MCSMADVKVQGSRPTEYIIDHKTLVHVSNLCELDIAFVYPCNSSSCSPASALLGFLFFPQAMLC